MQITDNSKLIESYYCAKELVKLYQYKFYSLPKELVYDIAIDAALKNKDWDGKKCSLKQAIRTDIKWKCCKELRKIKIQKKNYKPESQIDNGFYCHFINLSKRAETILNCMREMGFDSHENLLHEMRKRKFAVGSNTLANVIKELREKYIGDFPCKINQRKKTKIPISKESAMELYARFGGKHKGRHLCK